MSWGRRRYTKADFGRDLELLGFAPEVRFPGLSGTRRWRWDWADERRRICVEYQGVMRTAKGGADPSHASLAGLLRDAEKISEGQLCGWVVLIVNAKTVEDGTAMDWVLAALGTEEP